MRLGVVQVLRIADDRSRQLAEKESYIERVKEKMIKREL